MTALYLVFLILGLAVFAISIFGLVEHDFDFSGLGYGIDLDMTHDFDLGHQDIESHTDSPGIFSIRTISAFLAGFGLGGILGRLVLGWGIGGQLLLGFVIAFALGTLAYGIMKLMYSQQGGAVRDSLSLVGKTGVVTIGTGNQGIGECRVDNNHYTCREKGNKTLTPNEIVKVAEAEVGLLIVEKL